MTKMERNKELAPIVKIILVNADHVRQDEYSKKFMLPLIEGLLKRIQVVRQVKA